MMVPYIRRPPATDMIMASIWMMPEWARTTGRAAKVSIGQEIDLHESHSQALLNIGRRVPSRNANRAQRGVKIIPKSSEARNTNRA